MLYWKKSIIIIAFVLDNFGIKVVDEKIFLCSVAVQLAIKGKELWTFILQFQFWNWRTYMNVGTFFNVLGTFFIWCTCHFMSSCLLRKVLYWQSFTEVVFSSTHACNFSLHISGKHWLHSLLCTICQTLRSVVFSQTAVWCWLFLVF